MFFKKRVNDVFLTLQYYPPIPGQHTVQLGFQWLHNHFQNYHHRKYLQRHEQAHEVAVY